MSTDTNPTTPVKMERRNTAVAHVLQYFTYAHLPEKLAAISKPFADLAFQMADTLPSNPELTVALRKLLEAKDCAVRAFLCLGSPS